MTLSVWRYAHLALAIISSLFLVVASVTGVILAYDAVQEKTLNYRSDKFEQISLAELLPKLQQNYSEISVLEVDYNGFVAVKAMDLDGNDVEGIIDPQTGVIIAKPLIKSPFIQWVTAFHRSMFLKETGRLIIGLVSFLLILISISGLTLVIQRQRSLRRFFGKIVKEYFTQYFHVLTGRLMLIPILIIALSGTYLSLARFQLFVKQKTVSVKNLQNEEDGWRKKVSDFDIFKTTKLSDVKKIEFPFSEEPEESYTLKLKNKEILISQYNGKIIDVSKYPSAQLLENLSLDWHTGRTNPVLAIILGLASLNILFFIYSGFAIMLRRGSVKIKNKYKSEHAEIVFLVGSEASTTLQFAIGIHKQLLAQGEKSFIAQLNDYQLYPRAKHLVIFTSTYGLGHPPSNGTKALELFGKLPQNQYIDFSVVGFGSNAYPDFCKFSKDINTYLFKQSWSFPLLPIFTVDNRSPHQFVEWVKAWSEKTGFDLSTTPAKYTHQPIGLEKMIVLERTEISEKEHSFRLLINSPSQHRFTSGDLLAVYPNQDHQERIYSVAKINNHIQLIVKNYPNGLGSTFLNSLQVGNTFKARFVKNESFYRPKNQKVIMIANGTGIAPFLGMIAQSHSKEENYLYAGFRNNSSMVQSYRQFLEESITKKQLTQYQFAISKEDGLQYVMDLINQDAAYLVALIQQGAVIMICGSLTMQMDVEAVLDRICKWHADCDLNTFRENGQLLTDCY